MSESDENGHTLRGQEVFHSSKGSDSMEVHRAHDSDEVAEAVAKSMILDDSDEENDSARMSQPLTDTTDAEVHDSDEDTGPAAGHEILDLFMSTFSGMKDDFGKDVVPPLPLSYDRVSEGRIPVSQTRLFQLPFEILALIVQFITGSSLSQFALVNSDCRQLARSRQFASLHLDYSNRVLEIIDLLLLENKERLSQGGMTKKPALGPCIRRITVATHPGWIKYRHDVELSEEFNALPKSVKSRRMANASNAFSGSYMVSIHTILSNRSVLPHLELLDWEDRISLQPPLFNALVNSTIQHLKIYRAPIDKLFTIDAPQLQPSKSWPLRSLHLEILPALSTAFELDVSRLCTNLLHLCAPTLETLQWNDCLDRPMWTNHFGSTPPFPSLRHLQIPNMRFKDDTLLKELIQVKIQSLECDTSCEPLLSTLEKHGQIPALGTFVWATFFRPSEELPSLAFLEANPQLSKLKISYAAPTNFLNQRVIPLLTKSFSKLTSLSLAWDSPHISQYAIASIGQIETLEQLRLSAGNQYGWKYDWLIDHDLIQHSIASLPCLKKLAFSRDSYSNGVYQECDLYYDAKWLHPSNVGNPEWNEERFEEGHRNRMSNIAAKYIERMPRLEWLYIGQIPMTVRWHSLTGIKRPCPLTTKRDDCYTLLNEMFGWKGLLPS